MNDLAERLVLRKWKANELPPIMAGIYTLFLDRQDALPMLELRDDGFLYVGMTTDDTGARNHFEHKNSGFSSPRRSLGALLKEELRLTAIPRGTGQSRRNWTNYRFSHEGESRLTAWMWENLRTNHVPLACDEEEIERIEKQLIKALAPPLNINGAPRGANRSLLERLRSACRDEARKNISCT